MPAVMMVAAPSLLAGGIGRQLGILLISRGVTTQKCENSCELVGLMTEMVAARPADVA